MPYGRNTKVRTGMSSNPVTTTGGKRYYRKKPYKRKANVKTNAYKVARLQHQVNRIRLNAYGKPQKSLQFADRLDPATTFSPWRQYPLLINLSDLRPQTTATNIGCPIYQQTPGGTAVLQIGTFRPYSNGFWNACNQDLPDTGQIWFNGFNFKTEVKGTKSLVDDVYVNFTVFKYKPGKVQMIDPVSGQGLIMPTALGQLADMTGSNKFNKTYFKTFRNKTMYLNSRTSTATPPAQVQRGTTGNILYDVFSMKPRRLVNQARTSTVAGDEDNMSLLQGWRAVNTTVSTDLWLLISCNLEYPASGTIDEQVLCDFTRSVYWRDAIGSGA